MMVRMVGFADIADYCGFQAWGKSGTLISTEQHGASLRPRLTTSVTRIFSNTDFGLVCESESVSRNNMPSKLLLWKRALNQAGAIYPGQSSGRAGSSLPNCGLEWRNAALIVGYIRSQRTLRSTTYTPEILNTVVGRICLVWSP